MQELVLGEMLLDTHCLNNGVRVLNTWCFDGVPSVVFKVIRRMLDAREAVDVRTVAYRLATSGDVPDPGGAHLNAFSFWAGYVADLTIPVCSTANFDTHCLFLLEVGLKRRLEVLGEELGEDREPMVLMDHADKVIQSIGQRIASLKQHSIDFYLKEADKVETGYTVGGLDVRICPGELVCIAGRPGHGKSAMILHFIRHLCIPAVLFSFEMRGVEVIRRLRRTMGDAEIRALMLDIYSNPRDMRGLRAKIRQECRNGKKAVFIDYLQLMSTKGDNRNQGLGQITRELKQLSMELDVPIIILSQLSRAVEGRSDKMPQLSDLRDSGEIENDVDTAIMLCRLELYKEYADDQTIPWAGEDAKVRGSVFIGVAKYRNGRPHHELMQFSGEQMTFQPAGYVQEVRWPVEV